MTATRQLTDAERVVGYILLWDANDYVNAGDGNPEARAILANLRAQLIDESANGDIAGIVAAQMHLTDHDCTRWRTWKRLVSAEVRS